MDNPSRYAARPLAFLACYVRARPCSHAAIMMAVVGAVGCSVGAQYAVKVLVDTLAGGLYVGTNARDAWLGFLLLATLIAVDNLLWRLASWIASYTFVAVTGDLRRDLFRHLTGHAPSYFADRMPGTLTSRITGTSNAGFTLQNMSVVTVVLIIALLAWAIVLWQNGAATAGDVVLVCTLGLSILHATRDLAVALVDVTQHLARLSEALATLLVPHRLRDHPEATSFVRSGATVAFENIDFCYPDGRRVFSNFSLRIEPGQRVGLVGQSGCGKSTLFVLLQRFYDVQGGHILLGGQDIARVTQESLRAAIAVVPQDISLFHRSIMENIRYGRPDASDADVHEAIVAANCGDFIEHLPEGVATIVGDRGVKLSPGQRQRIGIARAFLKDAPILLLDEATSALDSDSEEAVRQALDRLMV